MRVGAEERFGLGQAVAGGEDRIEVLLDGRRPAQGFEPVGAPEQCSGLADAPYPGSGTNQPCARDHPFRALSLGRTPRIAGGDTLIIGSGSYRMGYGAPETEACDSGGPWDRHMPPVREMNPGLLTNRNMARYIKL